VRPELLSFLLPLPVLFRLLPVLLAARRPFIFSLLDLGLGLFIGERRFTLVVLAAPALSGRTSCCQRFLAK
jgi:hypothetical protein